MFGPIFDGRQGWGTFMSADEVRELSLVLIHQRI